MGSAGFAIGATGRLIGRFLAPALHNFLRDDLRLAAAVIVLHEIWENSDFCARAGLRLGATGDRRLQSRERDIRRGRLVHLRERELFEVKTQPVAGLQPRPARDPRIVNKGPVGGLEVLHPSATVRQGNARVLARGAAPAFGSAQRHSARGAAAGDLLLFKGNLFAVSLTDQYEFTGGHARGLSQCRWIQYHQAASVASAAAAPPSMASSIRMFGPSRTRESSPALP